VNKAAGILFTSINGNALFLKRGPGAPDFPGFWDFPGGGQEGAETAEQTALRETREEIGFIPEGDRKLHTRTKGSSALQAAGGGLGTVSAPPVADAVPATPGVGPNGAAILMPSVDFTTFLQKVTNEFVPELDGEHVGYSWSPIDSPPEPLHPGCRVALDRISMNELGVARAIADGRLTSPQRYGTPAAGVTLFAIRITGTDVAYRRKIDEFVHRNPDNYLNPEFLARCNGLPVIYMHPKTSLLNSEEFSERVVGSIFLPYIAGDEVWGVAKIYDDEVAQEMEDEELSTSPAVYFHDMTVNTKLTTEDGRKVFIEGDPSLLDHVAVCKRGVWDKLGVPSGIRSESREDSAMTEAEQAAADKAKKDAEEAEAKKKADAEAEAKTKADAEAKAKADAEGGVQLDKVLSKMDAFCDSMSKRMDAVEASEKERKDAEEKRKADAEEEARKKGDPEQIKADKAKKDAEEAAEAKKKADAEEAEKAKAKADSDEVRKKVDALAAQLPKRMDDKDYAAVIDAQFRADDVFQDFGLRAPRPLEGETKPLYDRRIARMLKDHSPLLKNVDLAAFADDAAFEPILAQIFKDAKVAAMNPTALPDGGLRMITKKSGGHEINTFVGKPDAWMGQFAGPVRQNVTGFKQENRVGINHTLITPRSN
jgi:8-oxo-dGTP pyrophosphatase MutT (NUDIX family)